MAKYQALFPGHETTIAREYRLDLRTAQKANKDK